MTNRVKQGSELSLGTAQQIAPLLKPDGIRIRLIETSGKSEGSAPPDARFAFNLRCNALWTKVTPTSLLGAFHFQVKLESRSGDEDAQPLGAVVVQYHVLYEMNDGVTDRSDDDLESFVGLYGMTHLWPYARAEVQAITTKLDFPPLTLPVLKVGQPPSVFAISRFDEPKSA